MLKRTFLKTQMILKKLNLAAEQRATRRLKGEKNYKDTKESKADQKKEN